MQRDDDDDDDGDDDVYISLFLFIILVNEKTNHYYCENGAGKPSSDPTETSLCFTAHICF